MTWSVLMHRQSLGYVPPGGVWPAATGPAAPVNTVAPALSYPDGMYPNAVVTCSTGSWANTPTGYTYQWRKDGIDIGGATTNTRTILAANVGGTLTCRVTASNATGSAGATSDGQRVLWSPLVWGSTAYRYLDSSDPAGLTEASGTVTQINDLSGSAHPQVQATQAAQPVKRTSAFFANKNVVYFNGVQTTGPFMQGVETSASNATDFSFLVFKLNMATGTAAPHVAAQASPSTGDTSGNAIIIAAGAGTTNFIRATFGGAIGPSYAYDGSRALMWCAQQLSTGGQTSGDGNTFVAETTPTARTVICGRTGLSVNVLTSSYGPLRSEMDYAVWVQVRSFVPTQSDVDKLFGWAAYKFGLQTYLPVGHTYKSSPP